MEDPNSIQIDVEETEPDRMAVSCNGSQSVRSTHSPQSSTSLDPSSKSSLVLKNAATVGVIGIKLDITSKRVYRFSITTVLNTEKTHV